MLAFSAAGALPSTQGDASLGFSAWTTGAQPHRDAFQISRLLSLVLSSGLMRFCGRAGSQFGLRQHLGSGIFWQSSLGPRLAHVHCQQMGWGETGEKSRNGCPRYVSAELALSAKFSTGPRFGVGAIQNTIPIPGSDPMGPSSMEIFLI